MPNNTLILSQEVVVGAGIGNSTTVNKATLVRVYNDSGSVNVIHVIDSSGDNTFSGIGSISIANGGTEYIEKPADYNIYGKAAFRAAKVGFTN